MSLIGEALNKARQEAARQEAARQRLPYAVGAIEPPRRRGSLGPLLAGVLVGCLAVGGLFGVAYLAGWGPWSEREKAPESVPPAVAEAAPAPLPAAPADASPVPVAPSPPPSVAPEPLQQREAEPEIPAPQPQVTITPEPVLAPEPSPTPPVEVRPAEPAPQPPPAPAPQEAKSYVGEVPVPGGGVLKLSGIAFSETSPVVVIDGRVMGPGESAQGFLVVEIQSNRVKLEGHGETVYVSLK